MKRIFKVGENVVCPSHGVGIVSAIENRAIGGEVKKFYVINILSTNIKLMLPVECENSSGIRGIVDLKGVKEVFKVLKSSPDGGQKEKNDRWTKRCRRYSDMIKTGSPVSLAEVTRDLLHLSTKKELSFAEKKILENARNMLVKELALASSKSEDEINRQIDRIFFRV